MEMGIKVRKSPIKSEIMCLSEEQCRSVSVCIHMQQRAVLSLWRRKLGTLSPNRLHYYNLDENVIQEVEIVISGIVWITLFTGGTLTLSTVWAACEDKFNVIVIAYLRRCHFKNREKEGQEYSLLCYGESAEHFLKIGI